MKNKNQLFRGSCLLAILFFGTASCSKFVTIDLPDSQIATQTAFEDSATATAAMVNIYAAFRTNTMFNANMSGISPMLGTYVDEIDRYNNPQESFYILNVIASNSEVLSLWNSSYKQVYASNAVLEGVEASATLPASVKSRLTGEALFARGMLHFYLTNLYGDIPFVNSTDYRKNSAVKRLPVAQVYDSVINDLKKAAELLPDNYLTAGRVRPNKSTAMTLLARAYLYNQQWEKAEDAADYVIGKTDIYQWETNLDKVFLKDCMGTIWQLHPSATGSSTSEAQAFIFQSGPPPNLALTENFIQSIEPGDLRLQKWVKEITNGADSWYHVNKYKQRNLIANRADDEYSIMFRLSELYLIRAEARIEQEKFITGLEDLNKVRSRALPGEITSNDKDVLRNAILSERRIELVTELGHRFFDLKRMGKLDEVMTPYKTNWKSAMALLPVPENEILMNPNLKPQNDGY